MNTKHTRALFGHHPRLAAFFVFSVFLLVASLAQSAGAQEEPAPSWDWAPAPVSDSVTVTTDYGTYSVDTSTGAITDSSGAVIGYADASGNYSIDSGQYAGSSGNVSGLGDVSASGSYGGVDYGVNFIGGSGLNGQDMVAATLIAQATATQLGGGTVSQQSLAIISSALDANPNPAFALQFVLAGGTLSQYQLAQFGLTSRDPAAQLQQLQQQAIQRGQLVCTSGDCLNSANFTYSSLLGYGSGWFSTGGGAGGSGSGGSTWTPPPGCSGASCLPPGGGSGGGGGGGETLVWVCSYISCTSTSLQGELQTGGGNGGFGTGGSGGNQATSTRPDARYEEF